MVRALSGETIAYDCTCTESAFAYVFPNSPYDIYMCPTFFRSDLLGTDSQAGTIVHELSHFAVLAGTRDYRYGQQSVAALATEDPDRAIGNADSHEYFAENTPALPMSAGASGDGPANALSLDIARGGTLASGESAVFSVTGAETIALESLSGDADLFVFDAPSTDDDSLVCASENGAGTIDVCPRAERRHALRRRPGLLGLALRDRRERPRRLRLRVTGGRCAAVCRLVRRRLGRHRVDLAAAGRHGGRSGSSTGGRRAGANDVAPQPRLEGTGASGECNRRRAFHYLSIGGLKEPFDLSTYAGATVAISQWIARVAGSRLFQEGRSP